MISLFTNLYSTYMQAISTIVREMHAGIQKSCNQHDCHSQTGMCDSDVVIFQPVGAERVIGFDNGL